MKGLLFLVLLAVAQANIPPAGFPDSVDDGYPQSISLKWAGLPGDADAAFQRTSNGKIYVFKGPQYYRFSDKYLTANGLAADTLDAGYPKSIKARWGIDGPVQAAFQRKNGKIYLFTGTTYYRFTDKYLLEGPLTNDPDTPDAGYPQNIAEKFVGVPAPVDGGFYRSTGHMYFFKGAQYYRLRDKYFFDEVPDSGADQVEGCYPKPISTNWIGLPTSGKKAVFQRSKSNQEIYFFVGSQYYRVTDKYQMESFPDRADTGYPATYENKFETCSTPGAPSVPTNVDAVFQRSTGKIYLFKGTQYWRVSDKYLLGQTEDCIDEGYPKDIASNWIGLPADGNFDAVFQRRSNQDIYFFRGNLYWRLTDKYLTNNFSRPDSVDDGYPQSVSDKFKGVPQGYHGAFSRFNYHLYFFKGDQYYTLKDKYFFDLADDSVSDSGNATEDFEGIVLPLRAIYQRSVSNEKIYAFSTTQYVRFTDQFVAEAPPCCTSGDDRLTWTNRINTLQAEVDRLRDQLNHQPTPAPTPAPCGESRATNEININFAKILAR